MKYYVTISCLLIAFTLTAQTTLPLENSGYAVIKGHVGNQTDNFWEFGLQGYFSNQTISVPINKNGNFDVKVKVEGEIQDAFLGFNDGIPIFFQKNDTIEINWDAKDSGKTITVKNVNPNRNNELQRLLLLNKLYIPEYREMVQSFYQDKLTDSVKFTKINSLYNKEMEFLWEGGLYFHTGKMAIDIYYRYASILMENDLLRGRDLFLVHPGLINDQNVLSILTTNFKADKLYKRESEDAFKTSSTYRDFLFGYVRFNKPLNSWSPLGNEKEQKEKVLPFTPVWDTYYAGLSSFYIKEIRDWFIIKSIMEGFNYQTFEESDVVYHAFLSYDKAPYFVDTLKNFYAVVQRVKPGSAAPAFTLKNEDGQPVSLSDFKGKVVYIDFWGVNCGPCMYDIHNNVPKLHEKYKDQNIVFINICVDSEEKEWKESLEKSNLQGINLIAPGGTNNKACIAYGIQGIPHYYLINKEGKTVNNNSQMYDMTALNSEIDKLLL